MGEGGRARGRGEDRQGFSPPDTPTRISYSCSQPQWCREHFVLCDNLVNKSGCHRANFYHILCHMGLVLKHDTANLKFHGLLYRSLGQALHRVDTQVLGPGFLDPVPPMDQQAWMFLLL